MAFGALWRGRAQPQTASSASMSRSSSGRGDLIHCLSPLQQPLQVTPSVTAAVASNLCPRINRHRQAPRSSTNSVGHSGAGGNHHHQQNHHRTPWWKSWTKKYVILCCLCGGTAVLLGVVFLVIYFVLNHYTTSLQYFETIPTYAPALVLIVTGLLVMCFARRRNRYAYLIKVAGGCCLMCALLCVVITVTTTVIHMNRLQTLRECVYTKKSKTCTCFAGIGDDEGAARYVFNDTPDCEVVHGGLYTCLRAMFGLSVVGILVCIFSSMLVYQLLSHEKKKMYWEQLEMRRRFFYRQSTHPLYCNCYDDYGFAAPSTPHDLYHWQSWEVNSDRCWPSRSFAPRLGFGVTHEDSAGGSGSQRSILIGSTGHRASGWNWLPWSRSRPSQVSCSGNNQSCSGGGGGGDSSVIAGVADSDQAATSALADDQSSLHHLHHHHQVFPSAAAASHLHHLHHHQYHHPTTYWGVDQSVANNTVNRHSSNSGGGSRRGHRRRRSNDAIFHHLNMTPPFVTDASYAPSYATYSNMPPPPPPHHHLWGPPPPYSRPPSAENVTSTSLSNNSNGGINITPRGRFMSGVALPTVGGGTGVQQSPIMMLQTSADDLSTNVLVRGRSRPLNDRQENKPLPPLPSNDIFVDIGSSFSSEYEQSRANKRMHHHGPDWTGTVPLSARQQRTTDSESNCSKSTPHIPRICIWPSESCLLEIVSDAVIRKEGRRGLSVTREANDGDSEEASVITEAEQSSSSESFEVEVDDDDDDDDDEDDEDDDDDDLGSNFRTSMMVSTAPSTPIIDENPSCFSVDMTVAHSLPNLNLSLGPLSSAANNYSSEDNCKRVTRGDQTHESGEEHEVGKFSKVVMMTTSQQPSPLITDVHVPLKLDNRQPVPSSAVDPPSAKVRIQCPLGMSDSSPALPPFFRTDNNQDDAAAAHRYLSSIENLFQRHCAANYLDTTTSGGGIKSKSLGNLSPNDNIIVTFKSIHV